MFLQWTLKSEADLPFTVFFNQKRIFFLAVLSQIAFSFWNQEYSALDCLINMYEYSIQFIWTIFKTTDISLLILFGKVIKACSYQKFLKSSRLLILYSFSGNYSHGEINTVVNIKDITQLNNHAYSNGSHPVAQTKCTSVLNWKSSGSSS